ncbi:Hpt domain-containing protein [Planctomycetota bacterium]|nr:Hpt domain-containing protein [Planctomycetota bacterium]
MDQGHLDQRWREVYGGDGPIYSTLPDGPDERELLSFFVGEMTHHIKGLEEGMREGDMQKLKMHAHQIKGAGGSFGFDILTDLGRELDDLLRGEVTSEDEIADATERLLGVCRRVSVGHEMG